MNHGGVYVIYIGSAADGMFIVLTILMTHTESYSMVNVIRVNALIEFFKQHIEINGETSDIIAINDMCDYANEFSKSLYGKVIENYKVYKFFKSLGHHPKQKRIRYDRIRCYMGLKYVSLIDNEVPF